LGCDKPNNRQARTPNDGLREWSLCRWIPHPSDRTRVLAFSALWSYPAVQKGVDVAKAVEGESEPRSGRRPGFGSGAVPAQASIGLQLPGPTR
jgi:hypothetical protein